MPAPKFNFIPERQLKAPEKTCMTVSIQKNNQLSFGRELINIYDLDKKFIEFYVDVEKKTLGWSIFEHTEDISAMKTLRQIKQRKSGGCAISIGTLLKRMNADLDLHRPNLEVKIYSTPLLEKDIYYITL